MIQVGINENLVITEVSKNDKNSLLIKVKEAGEIDPLAALNSAGSTQFNQATKDLLIYPPSVNNFQGEVDTMEGILKKIAETKDPLDHILQQYSPKSNIKWDIFTGTGITAENIGEKITNQTTLDKIYANIVDQFIKMMTPFAGENSKKVRILFIRQSKAKHFPTLRKRFLESYPFIEPMDVPKAQSKLKFSAFEVTNGLNTGEAVSGAQTVTQEEKNTVEALFTTN